MPDIKPSEMFGTISERYLSRAGIRPFGPERKHIGYQSIGPEQSRDRNAIGLLSVVGYGAGGLSWSCLNDR